MTFAALLFLSQTASAGVPAGLDNCKDLVIAPTGTGAGHVLSGKCKKKDGSWVSAELMNPNRCAVAANNDGVLSCVTQKPQEAAASSGGDFQTRILETHNYYRCIHGVPALEWSDSAAQYAQNWVDGLKNLKHSNSYKSPVGPMGENLFYTSGALTGPEAPDDWYTEEKLYSYGGSEDMKAGHFTAMIWRDAKYVGCGVHDGIVSCNYWSGKTKADCSTPNMGSCYAEQVPRPTRSPAECK